MYCEHLGHLVATCPVRPKPNSCLSHEDTGVRVRLFLKTNNPTCNCQRLSATVTINSSCRLLPLHKIFLDILGLRLTLTGKIKTMKAKALTVLSSAYSQQFCPQANDQQEHDRLPSDYCLGPEVSARKKLQPYSDIGHMTVPLTSFLGTDSLRSFYTTSQDLNI